MKATANSVNVRWMVRRDMPEVVAIEQASFKQAWSEEHFLRELRNTNSIGLVAEISEKVVGFAVYRLHRDRFSVCNFAVVPEARRQGVGRALAEKLKGKVSELRRRKVEFLIGEDNLPAQLFLRACGFRAVEILRAARNEKYGAYVMEYRVGVDLRNRVSEYI